MLFISSSALGGCPLFLTLLSRDHNARFIFLFFFIRDPVSEFDFSVIGPFPIYYFLQLPESIKNQWDFASRMKTYPVLIRFFLFVQERVNLV
jgi:hypothetical protein